MSSTASNTMEKNKVTTRGGGCPVKHDLVTSTTTDATTETTPWGNWFRMSKKQQQQPTISTNNDANNINQSASISSSSSSSCPIQNGSITSIEEAAKHAQTPQPDQTIPLSTYRTVSSIPKGIEPQNNISNDSNSISSNNDNHKSTPIHQPQNQSNWVYPSEQQFFNAMKRKGWEIAPGTESTIPFVVQIHNAVNEKGWKEIREWETLRCNHEPRLVKFIGRPQDLSPKARFFSSLWLRNEPFDRHDWYVSREDGSDMRRYVIDFYNGREEQQSSTDAPNSFRKQPQDEGKQPQVTGLPSMYLDVRPALDDGDAALDRMKMFVKDAFPGIASVLFNNNDKR